MIHVCSVPTCTCTVSTVFSVVKVVLPTTYTVAVNKKFTFRLRNTIVLRWESFRFVCVFVSCHKYGRERFFECLHRASTVFVPSTGYCLPRSKLVALFRWHVVETGLFYRCWSSPRSTINDVAARSQIVPSFSRSVPRDRTSVLCGSLLCDVREMMAKWHSRDWRPLRRKTADSATLRVPVSVRFSHRFLLNGLIVVRS